MFSTQKYLRGENFKIFNCYRIFRPQEFFQYRKKLTPCDYYFFPLVKESSEGAALSLLQYLRHWNFEFINFQLKLKHIMVPCTRGKMSIAIQHIHLITWKCDLIWDNYKTLGQFFKNITYNSIETLPFCPIKNCPSFISLSQIGSLTGEHTFRSDL